ncbi:thioredoxin fold domain-containing protein [Salinicola aestuarinus]|uniref:thioredoxin fold domain-containing protein n=1 Tax=Salinicola aestuarinus TaxID=1949082 RepID=UPI000DA20BD2|nr:thioredoxin fold domain-containing protein [Salinicola aestuarinus]
MNTKLWLALPLIATALTGCKTMDQAMNSTQSYMSSLTQSSQSEEVKPLEITYGSQGRVIQYSSLPLEHSIKKVNGTGEREMAVLMEPGCPYSRILNDRLDKLDNTTVHIFMGPFFKTTPVKVAQAVNCQADNQSRLEAYEAVMHGGVPTNASGALANRSCRKTQIEVYNVMLETLKAKDVGTKVGNSTALAKHGVPVIFFEDSSTVYGAAETSYIENKLESLSHQ